MLINISFLQSASIQFVCRWMSPFEVVVSLTINHLLLGGDVCRRAENHRIYCNSSKFPFLTMLNAKSNTKSKANYSLRINSVTPSFVLAFWTVEKTVVRVTAVARWCNLFSIQTRECINITKLVLFHTESDVHERIHRAFTPVFSTLLTGFKKKSKSKIWTQRVNLVFYAISIEQNLL